MNGDPGLTRPTLLTGASGFIGSRIARALSRQSWNDLTVLIRDSSAVPRAFKTVEADLRDGPSVNAVVAGMDTVVHSASYIGNDPALCAGINIEGTENLVRSAKRFGVRNLIYVSTTAVYGSGPHRWARAESTPVAPASVLSQSRFAAERIILDAGGAVIRPALVYGVGDRWVVPTLARLTATLGGLVGGGEALASIIRVEDLGALVEAVARHVPTLEGPRIYHAANSAPTSIADLTRTIRESFSPDLAMGTLTREEALVAARKIGLSDHQLDLVTIDHTYEANELWALADRRSPSQVRFTVGESSWYRQLAVS
jgi:nucleoside-diphosphate-sugar epimerase